ncbi:hypothetical protein WJX73_010725 [Symbiochloris irregularis]|uniref:Uncharacterized protein n=1 Tax=Symbiochloris irregularis TaxID=706552 RepID=A0AAW1PWP1_9CHLO
MADLSGSSLSRREAAKARRDKLLSRGASRLTTIASSQTQPGDPASVNSARGDSAATDQAEQLVRPASGPLPVSDDAQPRPEADETSSAATMSATKAAAADLRPVADARPAVAARRSEARLQRWGTGSDSKEIVQTAQRQEWDAAGFSQFLMVWDHYQSVQK